MKVPLFHIALALMAAAELLAIEPCALPVPAKPADHFRSGECWAAKGQWKEAEEQFRFCRRSNPRAVLATVSHANALIRLSRPFEAVIELHDLLEQSPDSVPALKLYAALLEGILNHGAKAEQLLEKCSTLAPSDPEVWRALGNLYLNQQQTANAIRSFEKAVQLSPADPLLLAGLASSYGQANRSDRAEELFGRAVEANRQGAKPKALVSLMYADYLLYQDRAADSLPVFTSALSIDPHSSNAYYGRASAYEKLEDLRHAELDALAAIRESPSRKDAHLLLTRIYRSINDQEKLTTYVARVEKLNEEEQVRKEADRRSSRALQLYFDVVDPLLREQKYEEAIKRASEVVELSPDFPMPLFVLAVCYSQTGQPDQAERFFAKYLALQPDSPDGHAALGILLLQQGRGQEATKELERAISLDPGSLEARKALASLYLSGGNPQAAVQTLRVGDVKLDSEARLILAEALFLKREPAAAFREVELVLRAEPANSDAARLKQMIRSQSPAASKDTRLLTAQDLMKQKSYRKAIEVLESIIRSNPLSDSEAYVMLAACRLNVKENDEAIRVSERALQLFPGLPRLEKFYVSLLRATCTGKEMKAKLAQGLQQNPDSPAFLLGLGEALLAEDPNAAQIESLLSKAAKLMPDDPEVHYLYGQWACLTNRNEVSIQELTKALQLTPDNGLARMQTYTYLGMAYDHSGQSANADQAFRKAVALNQKRVPPDPGVVMQYAEFLRKEQRQGESQGLIVQILDWAPSFAPAHLERARFLAEQQKMNEAVAQGELALRYSGSDKERQRAARVFLASTLVSLGRTEEAQPHQQWIESH